MSVVSLVFPRLSVPWELERWAAVGGCLRLLLLPLVVVVVCATRFCAPPDW